MAIDYNAMTQSEKLNACSSQIMNYTSRYNTPLAVLEEILEYLQANYKTGEERSAEKKRKEAKKKRK